MEGGQEDPVSEHRLSDIPVFTVMTEGETTGDAKSSMDFSAHAYYDDDYDDYFNESFGNTSYGYDNDLYVDDDSNVSGWCDAGEHEFTIAVFQSCFFCLVFVLGVVGNSLVIATFTLYRSLHLRSMTDVFLFHLALADLLLLLTLPLQAVDTHVGWVMPAFLCKAMRTCYAINTYSGLQLLACISVDRYLVVAQAQEMLRLRSRILRLGTAAAAAVWLVAVLLSLPEILFSGVLGSGRDAYCGVINSREVKMATYGAIIGVFCLSFVVMVWCYSLIGRVLWEGQAQRRGKQWHRQRTLKLMVALVLVFLVFQLPYTVVLSLRMAGPFCNPLLEYVTCTLAYTRCCLNPILYALVGVRFRSDVLRVLQASSCRCGLQLWPRAASSASSSSPALTPLSACSPTSPSRSYLGSEAVHPIVFHAPGTK